MILRLQAVIVFLFIFCLSSAFGQQKVGLVLSGGGATGFAHIGVLKALEENNIKIDYITGTSAGSFIGGLYSAGYSATEIEQIVMSEDFQLMVKGKMKQKDQFYFYEKWDDASLLRIRFKKDSIKFTTLPTNYTGSALLDYEMLETFGLMAVHANCNFDSLFIPFRCVASDIYTKQPVVFSEGNLNQAIRASMTFPFYIKPIRVNGVLLFDGGLYNNFPVDVMIQDFHPDIIIGSNVSYNEPPPHEDDLLSQLKNMLISHTDFSLQGNKGILINPQTDIKTFEFHRVREAIDSGYSYTLARMDSIKQLLNQDNYEVDIESRRNAKKEIVAHKPINSVMITGLRKGQAKYVQKKLLNVNKRENIDFDKFRARYFRLMADRQIRQLYPTMVELDTGYQIRVDVKKEKDFMVEVGGHIATRPISMGYLSFAYQNLSSFSFRVGVNGYFGKFYNSIKADITFGMPTRWPLDITPYFILNRWDYINSYFTFFTDPEPSFLIQQELIYGGKIETAASNQSKVGIEVQGSGIESNYYQADFTQLDTADVSRFSNFSLAGKFDFNTLNRKQFASAGHQLTVEGRWVIGHEEWYAGSTAFADTSLRKNHSWFLARVHYEGFLVQKGFYRLGLHAEGVWSTQSFFSNYTATILNTPSYEPIPDMKTFFLDNYRSYQYAAVGLINIFTIKDIVDFRLEAYYYQPIRKLVANEFNQASYNGLFVNRYYVASVSVIYNSPIGPLRLTGTYMDGKEPSPWNVQVSYGFVLFNKKAIQ
ncbi:MAG: patatin-like phospholipase family protein [Crocinitomicaceae bacterium]|nr:patatin-like phospholipase family protein [Crocinitomicaceae bacterium]